MNIYKTKPFAKFAQKQQISDKLLVAAIKRAEQGLIDAELGQHIIKQRIARTGQGKSAGYRPLIFYRINDNHFFVVGFAKNDRENISNADLQALKLLAKQYEAYSTEQIQYLVKKGILIEVNQHDIF